MTQQSTFQDLKFQFKERLNLEPAKVTLFADQAMRKKYQAPDSQLLSAAGIKHGDTLFIGNQDVVMTSVVQQEKQEQDREAALKRREQILNAPPPDPNAQPQPDQKNVGITTINTKEDKAPKVIESAVKARSKEEDLTQTVAKHEAFDATILESKKKCAKSHPPS